MRTEVIAASRHEYLVLYDPAAIPLDTPLDPDLETQDPVPLPESALVNLAEDGRALVFRIADTDCQATIRLLVEEIAEPSVKERAVQVMDGAILRVPTGKLTADGVEFLCRPGETRLHSEGVSIDIPAGNYEVQVWNLMPWKSREHAVVIDKTTTKTDRIVGRVVAAYTWLGILLVPANILVAPAAVFIVWLAMGWQQALALAGSVILVDLLILGGFWVLDFASRWVPALRGAIEAESAFNAANPDVVVCLRRLPAERESKVPAMATLAVA